MWVGHHIILAFSGQNMHEAYFMAHSFMVSTSDRPAQYGLDYLLVVVQVLLFEANDLNIMNLRGNAYT